MGVSPETIILHRVIRVIMKQKVTLTPVDSRHPDDLPAGGLSGGAGGSGDSGNGVCVRVCACVLLLETGGVGLSVWCGCRARVGVFVL